MAVTAAARAWLRGLPAHMRGLAGDARRYGWVSVPLAAVWILAAIRLFVDPTPRIPLLFNWSPSLPYHVAWLERGVSRLNRGDFVLYSFAGKAAARYPGLDRQPFFKIVAGLPGDRVRVEDRNVFVGATFVGFAKRHTFDGWPLTPVQVAVVPAGHYYVRGSAADSFDSRYSEAGFVSADEVIGRVTPWL